MAIQGRVSGTWMIFTHGWHPYPNRDGYKMSIFPARGWPAEDLNLFHMKFQSKSLSKFSSFCYIDNDLCWLLTLLPGCLTYLLNIGSEHMYIVLYSLKWLFWCVFYIWNDMYKCISVGTGLRFYPYPLCCRMDIGSTHSEPQKLTLCDIVSRVALVSFT
jgi:hypothetical protein